MKNNINFLLSGVGGQGTILASDVLVNAGLAAGYQAKQAEVHGMSQRGGSVTSHVRWGEMVYSPIVGGGEVDVLLAFEKAEALRVIRALKPQALVIINNESILPLTVTSGGQAYPSDDSLHAAYAQLTDHTVFVDGARIAEELGSGKAANVVLLGALSAMLEQSQLAVPELTEQVWLDVITERVPKKFVELNIKAFQAGRETVIRV